MAVDVVAAFLFDICLTVVGSVGISNSCESINPSVFLSFLLLLSSL